MSWTGKAVGAGIGAFILGPVGAAIGGVAGHWFDQAQEDQIPDEVQWRLAILSVYASAASANGEWHPKERKRLLQIAKDIFDGYPPQVVDNWFSTVEQTSVSVEDCAAVVRQLPDEAQPVLVFNILSVLYADGRLDPTEHTWVQQLVQCSGMNADLWNQGRLFFERGEMKSPRAEALAVLGLSGECSEHDIKSAYRRACKEYHPDHLGNLSAPLGRGQIDTIERRLQIPAIGW